MSLPASQLGWVAGVLDLRGKILRKQNQQRATPQIVIVVESSSVPVIRALSRLTGTAPDFRNQEELPHEWARRGCEEHCPDKHIHVSPNLPLTAKWTVTGAAAAVVLFNVLPFLMSDKGWDETFQECLDNVKLTGQGSGAVRKTLRRLEDLGWDLPPECEVLVADEMVAS